MDDHLLVEAKDIFVVSVKMEQIPSREGGKVGLPFHSLNADVLDFFIVCLLDFLDNWVEKNNRLGTNSQLHESNHVTVKELLARPYLRNITNRDHENALNFKA